MIDKTTVYITTQRAIPLGYQAQTAAEGALPQKGGNLTGSLTMNNAAVISSTGEVSPVKMLRIWPGESSPAWGEFKIVKNLGNKTQFWVDRDESDINSAHTILFVANGGGTMALEGIDVIQMKSTSGKKFNITVSDDGTLTTTEVTT